MPDDIRESTAAVVAAPAQGSFNAPAWMQPQSLRDVQVFAEKLVAAKWVPKSYIDRNGELDMARVEIAILHGMMIGIPWIMAPQVIAVINGMPSIWGDGMLAVVQASGLLEDIKEFDQGKGEDYSATCIVKRKGRPTPVEQTFDVWKAKTAGLLGKEGPWQTAPKRMMQMRARAFALRDAFPDVLKGLSIAEEALDMVDVTPQGGPPVTDPNAPPRPQRTDYEPAATVIDASAATVETQTDPEPPAPTGGKGGRKTKTTEPKPEQEAKTVEQPQPTVDGPAIPQHEGDWEVVKADGEVIAYAHAKMAAQALHTFINEGYKAAPVDHRVATVRKMAENNADALTTWRRENPEIVGPLDILINELTREPVDSAASAGNGKGLF